MRRGVSLAMLLMLLGGHAPPTTTVLTVTLVDGP